MTIIDAQLHEPAVSLEWEQADEPTRRLVLTELQLGWMRAVGVDRAVLFPVDLDWAEAAAELAPGRFGIVPMVTVGGALGGIDATAPDIDALIAGQASKATTVGIRILRRMPNFDRPGAHEDAPPELFERTVAAAERLGLPLFLSTAGDYETPALIAERHSGLTVIVDHLGIPQPPTFTPDTPPFKTLPKLLELARFPNVALKLSGIPTLSLEPFPYTDIWKSLHRVIDAFGGDRLMWGSDISRIEGRVGFRTRLPGAEGGYDGKHTYAEALFYLRATPELDEATRAKILGGTARALLRWSKGECPGGPG